MTYTEVLQAAKGQMGFCHACPVCNGRACGGTIPGPGAKGSGTVAIRNFDAWRNVRLNMDTIHENFEPDTGLELFGRKFKYPFFAGPVGAMTLHYGDKYNDLQYNEILVAACAAAGIAAFTGDGTNPKVMEGATAAIAASGGAGIPTVKPWDNATVAEKMTMARQAGCFAMAMDIDAAGLPFLQHLDPPAGSKTVEQLQEIAQAHGVSTARICLAYLLQKDLMVLPKASSKQRLEENLCREELVLSSQELKQIEAMPITGWSGENPDTSIPT